jgi:ATP-dependent Zn protease
LNVETASPFQTILLYWVLPLLIFIGISQFTSHKMSNRTGNAPNMMSFGMGKSNAKIYVKSSEGIKFSDVVGEDEAKEKAPCIVFIDEIDAIGKKRDGHMGGNDEWEQTLNQLLTEMDGFEGNTGVIILAATNRPESLDPALTRPGRFDRRVPVELPDLKGREEILRVHAKKIKVDQTVDFAKIARMASGASGAELANIVNEAALRAVRDGRKYATQSDLEESIEVVIAGYQKKNAILTDQEKWVVAYHEIGHALVAAKQYLGGDTSLACSAETQTKIDGLVVELVKKQHEKAAQILMENREKLDELAQFLYQRETITGEEFMNILNQ